MKSYIILTFGLLFLFSSSVFAGTADPTSQVDKQRCTIKRIEGPLIETSCKVFSFGEEIQIKDITGQPILPFQIPLPCSAELEIACPSEDNCSSILSIMILKKIKIDPE